MVIILEFAWTSYIVRSFDVTSLHLFVIGKGWNKPEKQI